MIKYQIKWDVTRREEKGWTESRKPKARKDYMKTRWDETRLDETERTD